METRKHDHIELAFSSRTGGAQADSRFDYEPMAGVIPDPAWEPFSFLGKTLRLPMWVSSMTGGTALARTINTNLARACREFGMGMGLGSCRILLQDRSHLQDFDMREIIGDALPLYANIGIAQLEEMAAQGTFQSLTDLVGTLRADGLIIHVNPMQEFLQEEGDRLRVPPLETIETFLDETDIKVIIKEVGQGMGPDSILKVMHLPIEAFEFGAFGGTNFSKLELLRGDPAKSDLYEAMANTGHTAAWMLKEVNRLHNEGHYLRCRQLIISGGIRSFLDGYYLISNSKLPAVFGQASNFLKYARNDYNELRQFIEEQIRGLSFARAFLVPKAL